MNFSRPSLHAAVVSAPAHRALVREKLSSILKARVQIAGEAAAPAGTAVTIPLTTVSLASNFDASISIRFRGGHADALISLWVDSGNSTLIVPDYDSLAQLPNFDANYTKLAEGVCEPWGCPANILRGDIDIPTQSGGAYTLPGCVFYACTGVNRDGDRTGNFGTGWVSPWPMAGGITMQPPLSYNTAYPFAEFNYASAATVMGTASEPKVSEGSSLTVFQAMPQGYQLFNILRGLAWMSLTPRSLGIGATTTKWPGDVASPIAMVDTGGGPVFLSDPNSCVYATAWPEQVPSPTWTSDGSVSCRSIKDNLTIEIGDEHNSFSYQIDTASLPDSAQGLTLVMCEQCSYMMGNQGMNIGGLSALFLDILIDYASGCVGFKSKQPVAI
jgi:hypothetical protein